MSETTVAVAIWDGVEELDVVGPYEVLTAWGAHSNGSAVHVYTVADSGDGVRCAHGLRLLPDRTWSDVGEIDVLVLPGGHAGTQVEDERVLARVRELGENGTLMTSVCTGALILAAAGLLEGRPATTHWSALEALASYGVEVRPAARFVDTGEVVTAAGVSAGIDMALHLVARLDSPERAKGVRRYIQYDPEPPV
jgi:transcriptional regulator GlxA family with amidase domain